MNHHWWCLRLALLQMAWERPSFHHRNQQSWQKKTNGESKFKVAARKFWAWWRTRDQNLKWVHLQRQCFGTGESQMKRLLFVEVLMIMDSMAKKVKHKKMGNNLTLIYALSGKCWSGFPSKTLLFWIWHIWLISVHKYIQTHLLIFCSCIHSVNFTSLERTSETEVWDCEPGE